MKKYIILAVVVITLVITIAIANDGNSYCFIPIPKAYYG